VSRLDTHNLLLPIAILLGVLAGIKIVVDQWIRDKQRERRTRYYRDDYLNSDNWKRKRALVLKRDGYKCVYCGSRATQVHHKKYAPRKIGREPIEWLVSVCDGCHRKQHEKR
jgi:5-methylcytosine-specific restriction endonuclease McrA